MSDPSQERYDQAAALIELVRRMGGDFEFRRFLGPYVFPNIEVSTEVWWSCLQLQIELIILLGPLPGYEDYVKTFNDKSKT